MWLKVKWRQKVYKLVLHSIVTKLTHSVYDIINPIKHEHTHLGGLKWTIENVYISAFNSGEE